MHGDQPVGNAPSPTAATGASFVDFATLVIAIDGPSGAGKSTVARGVARALGLRYLDTGAVYRALTWAVLDAGADPNDAAAVGKVASTFRLDISTDPDDARVSVGGADLTAAIRGGAVTASVSAVSALPQIRHQLVALQQAIVGSGGIVVEGRDIGTVVCPTAQVKVFLTASEQSRASRRLAEMPSGGELAAVQTDLARRDTLDSTRAVSPLKRASDAMLLDSTTMDAAAAIARVLDAVAAHAGTPRNAEAPDEIRGKNA